MNELYFDNKKFVTTKAAAAITNYAKDYVGQLARSGKVEAKLIGRSWYVSEEAILEHAFGKSSKYPNMNQTPDDADRPIDQAENFSGVVLDDGLHNPENPIDTPQISEVGDAVYGEYSGIIEPIQKNEAKYEHNDDMSLHDENKIPVNFEGDEEVNPIGHTRYWHDDKELYPTLHTDSKDWVTPDLSDDHAADSNLSTGVDDEYIASAEGRSNYEDVSKITLTLRNRLNTSQNLPYMRGRTASAYADVQRETAMHTESQREEIPLSATRNSWITWAAISLVAVIVLCVLYYAFSSETAIYIRR